MVDYLFALLSTLQDAHGAVATRVNYELVERTGDSMTGRLDLRNGALDLPIYPGDPVTWEVPEIYYVSSVDRVRVRLSAGFSTLQTEQDVLRRRLVSPNRVVTSGASSVTITFGTAEPDTDYAVFVTPNWNTSVWVTGKTTTQFVVNFGTVAPTGATIDVAVCR
jgi:hypothetical protein